MYASLDACAVVPVDQLEVDHADVTLEPTLSPDSSCRVTFGPGDHDGFSVEPVSVAVPSELDPLGTDGSAVDWREGGVVVDVANGGETDRQICHSHALADNGIWLTVRPFGGSAGSAVPAQRCDMARTIARGIVELLTATTPTIDWPKGSLLGIDVCALTEQSGLPASLGATGELRPNASHRDCFIRPGRRPVTVHVSASTAKTFGRPKPMLGLRVLTIADHDAYLSYTTPDGDDPPDEMTCSFQVDFGPNDQVARRLHGKDHEMLSVLIDAPGSYDCRKAIPAVTELVATIG